MSTQSPYLLADLPGYTPQIARLVVMLGYARQTTLAAVRGLTVAQLDHLHDARSNSIGALLAHIAGTEFAYQLATFEGRGLSPEDWRRWGAALELGDRGREALRGQPLTHYLELLREVRSDTLAELARRDDDWLSEQHPFWDNLPANHYFMWFHVLEDEINHRGQIRWLRGRLPPA